MDITSDADCAELDANILLLLADRLLSAKDTSVSGVSVDEIQENFGDAGVLRSGILVAKGRIRILSGGGQLPYVLTLP